MIETLRLAAEFLAWLSLDIFIAVVAAFLAVCGFNMILRLVSEFRRHED